MPRKISRLISDLDSASFFNRGDKGSHRNFLHEKGVTITRSGKLGDDAKPYQERLLRQKIKEAKKLKIEIVT